MSTIRSKLRQWLYPKIADKRKYPRRPISVKVTNKSSGFFSYYSSTNISMGGMFLKSQEPPPLNATLSLEFNLPSINQPFRVDAIVVRIMPHGNSEDAAPGMGIQFKDLSRDNRKLIEAFVNMEI